MDIPLQDIKDLRQTFLQELQTKGESCVHPIDLNRIKNDNNWLNRFLMHHDGDKKLALTMMWEVTEWRKNLKVNEIEESTLNMMCLTRGDFFIRGRDKDGAALFIFKCKQHVKGSKDVDELKRCVIYWFERLERQEKGKPITLFFDMEGCGLKNMDMDFTQYLIGLFKQYYPYFLNYIIIFEMPWILNAAFAVVKSWLPEKAVQKIKMLKKANIDTYIPLNEALQCWGGKDDYVFSFVPEVRENSVRNFEPEEDLGSTFQSEGIDSPTNNSVPTNKKVHFADGSPMSEAAPQSNKDADGGILSIQPSSVIHFVRIADDEYISCIDLRNIHSTINISYKMKTTAPEKFRVRPSAGILCPGEKVTITVTLLPGYHITGLAKDKFLVMSMPVDNANMTPTEVVDLWKNTAGRNVKQNRLRCTQTSYDSTDPINPKNGCTGTPIHPRNDGMIVSNEPTSVTGQSELVKLSTSVAKLQASQQSLQQSVRNTLFLQYITMGLVVFLGILLYFLVNKVLDGDSAVESYLRKSEL